MTIWAWVAIGAAAWIGLSLLVGLAIARVVGSIAHAVSDLIDDEEAWASAPLTRAPESPEESPAQPSNRPKSGAARPKKR
jgi:hypothetical protein